MLIDTRKLEELLADYIGDFDKFWDGNSQYKYVEDYKWIAIKQFQDNWNIEADDFASMFEKATSKFDNLMTKRNFYPLQIIKELAKYDAEPIRKCFKELSKATKNNVYISFKNFRDEISSLFDNMTNGNPKKLKTYQDRMAVSTFLWAMNPTIHYRYHWGSYRELAKAVGAEELIDKKNDKRDDLEKCYDLYDNVLALVKCNEEVVNLWKEHISKSDVYHNDDAFHIGIVDLAYYCKTYRHIWHT